MSRVRQVYRPTVKRRRGQLTQRELRVLLFAAAGYTVTATAQRIGVTAETVRCQRDACRRKLGATSIANAAALAVINGLFSAERQEQIREIAALRLEKVQR